MDTHGDDELRCEVGNIAPLDAINRDYKLDIADLDIEGYVALVSCPECGNVASIEWAAWVSGYLHVKIRCIERHWFLMLAEGVTYYGTDVPYQATPIGESA